MTAGSLQPLFRRVQFLRGTPLLVLASVLAHGPALARDRDPDAGALAGAIDAIVSRPALEGALVGVEVRSLASGKTLYSRGASNWMTPASTLKLLPSAAALDLLGPEARAVTSLESAARIDAHGRLLGDLYLVGRGDASLSARFHEAGVLGPLEALADALIGAGVRHVAGRLIGHDGLFPGERRGADWSWEDLVWRYGAEVSALSFADNCVRLRAAPGERPGEPLRVRAEPASRYYELRLAALTAPAGGQSELRLERAAGANVINLSGTHPAGAADWEGCVALEDPALWTATVFAEVLRDRGVDIGGGVTTGQERLPADARLLARHDGAPLSELLREINQESNNLHTELLLRRLAVAAGGDGSVEAGHAAIQDFLGRLGVDAKAFVLRDASGLSRTNLVTATGMVALLSALERHPHAALFRESLATAGRDGTLEHRMRGEGFEDRVRAKTGTLRHTFALAGYADSISGARLAFAIFVNHHPGSPGAAVGAVDAIARTLAMH